VGKERGHQGGGLGRSNNGTLLGFKKKEKGMRSKTGGGHLIVKKQEKKRSTTMGDSQKKNNFNKKKKRENFFSLTELGVLFSTGKGLAVLGKKQRE